MRRCVRLRAAGQLAAVCCAAVLLVGLGLRRAIPAPGARGAGAQAGVGAGAEAPVNGGSSAAGRGTQLMAQAPTSAQHWLHVVLVGGAPNKAAWLAVLRRATFPVEVVVHVDSADLAAEISTWVALQNSFANVRVARCGPTGPMLTARPAAAHEWVLVAPVGVALAPPFLGAWKRLVAELRSPSLAGSRTMHAGVALGRPSWDADRLGHTPAAADGLPRGAFLLQQPATGSALYSRLQWRSFLAWSLAAKVAVSPTAGLRRWGGVHLRYQAMRKRAMLQLGEMALRSFVAAGGARPRDAPGRMCAGCVGLDAPLATYYDAAVRLVSSTPAQPRRCHAVVRLRRTRGVRPGRPLGRHGSSSTLSLGLRAFVVVFVLCVYVLVCACVTVPSARSSCHGPSPAWRPETCATTVAARWCSPSSTATPQYSTAWHGTPPLRTSGPWWWSGTRSM